MLIPLVFGFVGPDVGVWETELGNCSLFHIYLTDRKTDRVTEVKLMHLINKQIYLWYYNLEQWNNRTTV